MVEKLKSGTHLFKTLYTWDRRYEGLPNVVIVPVAIPSWVSDSESSVYPKKEKCTMITSTKTLTPFQEKRVKLALQLDEIGVHVYGGTPREIDARQKP